jgi:hypothetical protein
MMSSDRGKFKSTFDFLPNLCGGDRDAVREGLGDKFHTFSSSSFHPIQQHTKTRTRMIFNDWLTSLSKSLAAGVRMIHFSDLNCTALEILRDRHQLQDTPSPARIAHWNSGTDLGHGSQRVR